MLYRRWVMIAHANAWCDNAWTWRQYIVLAQVFQKLVDGAVGPLGWQRILDVAETCDADVGDELSNIVLVALVKSSGKETAIRATRNRCSTSSI